MRELLYRVWPKACRAEPDLDPGWQGFLEPHSLFMKLTTELAQKLKAVQILTQVAPALSLAE